MHSIKKSILQKLLNRESATFSELKTKSVPSNIFSYHLRGLVTQKYLKKLKDGTYILTSFGKSHVDRISSSTLLERIQPKIVTLVICMNAGRDLLFYRRKKQPYFKKIGFPYGKIHLGESVAEAAMREFFEKTGLVATMRHRGDVYITVYDRNGDLLTHTLFHVFFALAPRGILKSYSPDGESFWSSMKEIPKEQCMYGVREILSYAQGKKKDFFKELVFKESQEIID